MMIAEVKSEVISMRLEHSHRDQKINFMMEFLAAMGRRRIKEENENS